MSAAGTAMIAATIILVRRSFMSMLMADRYFATASAVANLANSEGWNLKAPKSIHDLPPLVTVATKSVTTSSAMTMP